MSLRNYETIFIVAPSLAPDAVDRLTNSFEEIIRSKGGNVQATNKWGKRNLAYEIKKFKEGVYLHIEFEGDGEAVRELERRYRLSDSILKFITVKLERAGKLKKKGSERRQAKAEARAKRKQKRDRRKESEAR